MRKTIPYEIYTLTLEHEYVDDDGKRIKLDEPIKTCYMAMKDRVVNPPVSIVINDMMDKMKAYMLHEVSKTTNMSQPEDGYCNWGKRKDER